MQDQKPKQIQIPEKLYFKIGEVGKILGLPTYVLRFWETEFNSLNPKRTATGQRSYTKKDIELILEIKSLLYEKKFTIAGARNYLRIKSKPDGLLSAGFLKDLKAELKTIKQLLDK
jgi:DNA-binding transcriptional MerR regulator